MPSTTSQTTKRQRAWKQNARTTSLKSHLRVRWLVLLTKTRTSSVTRTRKMVPSSQILSAPASKSISVKATHLLHKPSRIRSLPAIANETRIRSNQASLGPPSRKTLEGNVLAVSLPVHLISSVTIAQTTRAAITMA